MAKKERVYVKGHTGILSVKDGAAYKPLVCLTSTAGDMSTETSERVNYCTQGETQTSIDGITETVNFDGLIIADSDMDETEYGYADMKALMRTKEAHDFKLEGEGRGDAQYFNAVITALGDVFPGDGDATFTGSMTINGEPSATDPSA